MTRPIAILFAVLIFCSASAYAIIAESIWDYEAVNSIGFGIHPKVNADYTNPDNKVTIEGVALAGVADILDPNSQYTAFIQDDTSDRGGMQIWAGSWFYGALWPVLRSTDYIDFAAGDRLRVTGFLADAGRGKVVINHRHSASPELVFHVEVIGHPGLPDPVLIPKVEDCNYFDQSRAGGGEFYQTRYTMLHGVTITGGTWGSGNLMTIADSTGSVGMLLSARGNFNQMPQPVGKLNVVGIFDQEDTTPPHTEGYRVWVVKPEDIALALDSCREGKTQPADQQVALVGKVVSRVYEGFCFVQDSHRAGGIKVITTRSLSPGDVISVQGRITTDGGETAIIARHIVMQGTTTIRPLFVTSPALWAESGLDTDGLLVSVYGVVQSCDEQGICTLTDDAGRTIKAQIGELTAPEPGKQVILTGVSSRVEGTPLILVANQQDIQVIE